MDAAAPLDNGRYRLVDVLGAGGMATVFRAWDARLEVWRAVKVLQASIAHVAGMRIRFENEARTMARLRHRNIVTVHDVGQDGDIVFIVMEMVAGGSLAGWVETHGPMAPRLASRVMAQVLDALQVAHDRGVVHRDIKPHNILLDADGTPKVTDFGIARLMNAEQGLTRSGAMIGTLAYMAPEQRDSARHADARSDVYSAAATLYAMLAARNPFDLYSTDLHDELYAGVSEPLAEVIRAGSRYLPEDRYPTCAAMREALLVAERTLPPLEPGTTLVPEAVSVDQPAPPAVDGATVTGEGPVFASGPGVAAAVAQSTIAPDSLDDVGSLAGEESLATSGPDPELPFEPPPPANRWGIAALLAAAAVVAVGGTAWVLGNRPVPAPQPEPQVVEPMPVPVVPDPAPDPVLPEPAPEPAPAAQPGPAPQPVVARPVPVPAPVPAPEPRAAAASLRVNAVPFGQVYVDGAFKGRTPWAGEVPSGARTVRIESSTGGRKELDVELVPGNNPVVCWDFDAEGPCTR